MIAKSVVFPAPFGPIRETMLPSETFNDASETACNPPKDLEIPETSSTFYFLLRLESSGQTFWQETNDEHQYHPINHQAQPWSINEMS